MIGYKELGRAGFDNDSRAAEGTQMPTLLSGWGFGDAEGIIKVAEQRALKLILMHRGSDEAARMAQQAYAGTFTVESLTDEEEELLMHYTAMWIDGLCCTAQALRSHDG